MMRVGVGRMHFKTTPRGCPERVYCYMGFIDLDGDHVTDLYSFFTLPVLHFPWSEHTRLRRRKELQMVQTISPA